jgi:hypothetical protein
MLHFWIPVNMSWQVQQHFGRIVRRHDSFEKHCNDKIKRCRIKRFHDNFNVHLLYIEAWSFGGWMQGHYSSKWNL